MNSKKTDAEFWKWYAALGNAEQGKTNDRGDATDRSEDALDAWLDNPAILSQLVEDAEIDCLLRFDALTSEQHESFILRCRTTFEQMRFAEPTTAEPTTAEEEIEEAPPFPTIRSESRRETTSRGERTPFGRGRWGWIATGVAAATIVVIGVWYLKNPLSNRFSPDETIADHLEPAPPSEPTASPTTPAPTPDPAFKIPPTDLVVEKAPSVSPPQHPPATSEFELPKAPITTSLNPLADPLADNRPSEQSTAPSETPPDPIQRVVEDQGSSSSPVGAAVVAQLIFHPPGLRGDDRKTESELEMRSIRLGQSIDLPSGTGELRFESGIRVFFQAPLLAVLDDTNQFRLQRGRVLIEVPSGAEEFRVIAGKHQWRSVRAKYQIHFLDPSAWETYVTSGHVSLAKQETTGPENPDWNVDLSGRGLNQAASTVPPDANVPTVLIARGKRQFFGQIGVQDDVFQTRSPESFARVVRSIQPVFERMGEPEMAKLWRDFLSHWNDLADRTDLPDSIPFPLPFSLPPASPDSHPFEFDWEKMSDDLKNGTTNNQGRLELPNLQLEFTSPAEFHRFRRQVRKQ